jgi:MFS transporter, DHA1 family, multidrug resistance protein
VDVYLIYAASALAANTVLRSTFAAAFPLFTNQLFRKLGIQWACMVIGFFALLLAPMPYLFWKLGPQIRARSKFAPCIDLKIRDAVLAEEDSTTTA